MKKIIATIVSVLTVLNSFSQSVAVNTSGLNADASAILDISSSNKGFLAPRMKTTQRTAIAAPANGLLVFDTDTKSFWFYNGTSWVNLAGDGNNNNWGLAGNSGTAPGTNFIGTTDAQPLQFKVNNVQVGMIHPNGNLFWGNSAGLNATGYSNIAIGNKALFNNVNRNNIVAIGDSALFNNGLGATLSYHSIANTAVGSKALYSNGSGYNNSAFGYNALYSNQIGTENIAFGSYALYDNQTGHNNIGIGVWSLNKNTTGFYNTAVGTSAMYFNISGSNNLAAGDYAMQKNTTGNDNVAVGSVSLQGNTSGNYNTSVGHGAMQISSTGNNNTALGYHAAYNNRGAFSNTAIGSASLYNNSLGNKNTAVGDSALVNVNASNNTAIGYQALKSITTGTENTAVGMNAYPISGTLINYTGIGYNVGGFNSVSNSVEIGNSSVTWIGGQVGWSQYSDGRIKKNISEDVPGLSFINKLRPVTYNIDLDKEETMLRGNSKPGKEYTERKDIERKKFTGFVAQEVDQASKASGYDFSGVTTPKNTNQLYSITYSEFVVPLVKAVQELSQQNEEMKKQIEELKQLLKK